MTQTTATTAVITRRSTFGVLVTEIPMSTVESARAEFGSSLEDAKLFLLDTSCTECGISKEEVQMDLRYCHGCAARGCDCLLVEDGHERDTFWCEDCQPICLCSACCPDD